MILKISELENSSPKKYIVETLMDSLEVSKDDLEPIISDSKLAIETLTKFVNDMDLTVFSDISEDDFTFIGDLKKINEFKLFMLKSTISEEDRKIELQANSQTSSILKPKFNKKSPIFFYSLLLKSRKEYLYVMFPY